MQRTRSPDTLNEFMDISSDSDDDVMPYQGRAPNSVHS